MMTATEGHRATFAICLMHNARTAITEFAPI
jgi:hypothetical protein